MALAIIGSTRVAAKTSGGTTTQEITASNLVDTPKAAILIVTRATSTSGTSATHKEVSFGMTDGTFEGGVVARVKDNVGSTQNNTQVFDDAVIRLIDDSFLSPSQDAKAVFDAWITGGIRIDWSDYPPAGVIVHAIFFAGEDLEVACGIATPPSSGNTLVNVGFEPDHLVTVSADNAADESFLSRFYLAVTQSINTGSGEYTRGVYARNLDNQSTSFPWVDLDDELAEIYYPPPPRPANYPATILDATTPYDSSGFRIASSSGGTVGPPIIYLAAYYGGKGFDLQVETVGTSSGNRAFTGYGFKPWSVFALATMTDDTWSTSTDTSTISAEAGTIGWAFFDADDEWCASVMDQYGVGTTNTASRTNGLALDLHDGSDSVTVYAATLSSFDSDGYTLNFGTPLINAQFLAFALEQDVITGTGDATLPTLGASSSGLLVFSAAGAPDLPNLQAAGVGVLVFAGAVAATLPKLQASGNAALVISGSGSATLPKLSASGSGSLTISGSAAATLPTITASGTGALVISGAGAATLPDLSASGVGVLSIVGSGAATLPSLAASATGSLTHTGSGAAFLPALEASGVVSLTFSATGDATLQMLAAAGTGALVASGAGAAELPTLEAGGTGALVFSGAGAAVLPNLEAAGVGSLPITGTGAAVLQAMDVAGSGALAFSGAGAAQLPALAASGNAILVFSGSGAAELPLLLADGAGLLSFVATGAGVLPLLEAAGSGTVTSEELRVVCDYAAGFDGTATFSAAFDARADLAAGHDTRADLEASYTSEPPLAAALDSEVDLAAGLDLVVSRAGASDERAELPASWDTVSSLGGSWDSTAVLRAGYSTRSSLAASYSSSVAFYGSLC